MHTAVRPLRRRGDVLVGAIHDAVMHELADKGYDALSIEAVAERAHTGKASIYRRWPTKLELVLDAIDSCLPGLGPVPHTGSLRQDLLTVLRRFSRHMNSPAGSALHACMADVKHHHELGAAVRARLIAPRRQVMLDLLRNGVARGDVRPDAIRDRIVDLGPTLLVAERQQRGATVRDADVVAIVDDVLVPLLRASDAT